MEFNWNDLNGNSFNALKEQCKSLCLEINKVQPTKRDLIEILKNYRIQMNLDNQQKRTSQSSENSSSASSRQISPVRSRMTPISTAKHSFLSSASHEISQKPKRVPTPVECEKYSPHKTILDLVPHPLYFAIFFILIILIMLLFAYL